MSDAGTYICRLPNGSETRTVLQLTPGCHNNLNVSAKWKGSSSLHLGCHHCNSLGVKDSFQWMLNSKPLGNPFWAKKSNHGSTITIHTIRKAIWGRWECHSHVNHSWISEICLSPLTEEDTGTVRITPENCPSAKPTSLAASHWSHPPVTKTTEATLIEPTIKGTPVWVWAVAVLLVVLAIIPAALGTTVWLWKRKQADRKHRENQERTDHPFLRYTTRKKEDIMKRESLHERSASIHYAQLQHLRRKSTTVQTPDSTTVYAVIV
ncbi:uncharacterized protein LOC121922717 [Sceloporus undulatus]|uniref:uncharacterized protein LOC121922717 n=1 Tax=Sceloporus undulatus TaxID=8520 RepID=UPI001C4B00DC|nr:uncharacterized protein LOC121922717 [Sceloporus undulatus]